MSMIQWSNVENVDFKDKDLKSQVDMISMCALFLKILINKTNEKEAIIEGICHYLTEDEVWKEHDAKEKKCSE